MNIEIDHEVDTGTVLFRISGNVVISEVKPYVTVSTNQVDELKKFVDRYIEGDFGFISIRSRKNEISINPSVWEDVFKKVPNMCAFALLTNSEITAENFIHIEKPVIEMYRKGFPAMVFNNLEEAYVWVSSQIRE
ncbi:MAG: hypothetical protein PVG66_03330 [Chromatiales bacterium]|jgi:hypothetical protein